MGNQEYPTTIQIAELKKKSEMNPAEIIHVDPQGQISIAIPPNGAVLLELACGYTEHWRSRFDLNVVCE